MLKVRYFSPELTNNFMNTAKKSVGFLQKFFTLNDSPHKIAAGAAIGLFVGILPIESISTSLIFTTIFRVNRSASLISVAATNFWAMVADLPLAAALGGLMFGKNPTELINQFNQTYRADWGYLFTKAFFYKFTYPLIIGYIITGGIISFAFYFVLYFVLKNKEKNL
jgi:uncharacterized protein (DUF2062 family)